MLGGTGLRREEKNERWDDEGAPTEPLNMEAHMLVALQQRQFTGKIAVRVGFSVFWDF